MPANWLKEECWLEDPQPPRPREPKAPRANKPKPHSSKGKMQGPTRAADRMVNKQQPVAKSANPVVEKPAHGKPVANGQTNKGCPSPEPPKPISPAMAPSLTARKPTDPPK